jgi:hypothetical protein
MYKKRMDKEKRRVYQERWRRKHGLVPDEPARRDNSAGEIWCPGCSRYLASVEFYKSSSSKHGCSSYCRLCAREKALERKNR